MNPRWWGCHRFVCWRLTAERTNFTLMRHERIYSRTNRAVISSRYLQVPETSWPGSPDISPPRDNLIITTSLRGGQRLRTSQSTGLMSEKYNHSYYWDRCTSVWLASSLLKRRLKLSKFAGNHSDHTPDSDDCAAVLPLNFSQKDQ